MTAEKVSDEQKVRSIIADHLQIDIKDVTNATNFIQDLAIEETDVIELFMEIETKLDVDLTDEHDNCETVQDVIKCIKAKKDAANKK